MIDNLEVEESNEVKKAREAREAAEKKSEEALQEVEDTKKAEKEAIARATIKKALDFITKYGGKHYNNPDEAKDEDKPIMMDIKSEGEKAVTWVNTLCGNMETIFKEGMKREIKKTSTVQFQNGDTVKKEFFIQFKESCYEKSIKTSIALFISNKKESHSPVFLAIEMKDKESSELDYRRHNRLLDYNRKLPDGIYCTFTLNDKSSSKKNKSSSKKDESSPDHILNHGLSKDQIINDIKNKKIQKVRLQYDIKIDDENLSIMEQIEKGIKLLLPYYNYVLPSYNKNIILYGPPGTGKTYHAVHYAVGIIEKIPYESILLEPYENVLERYNDYKNQGKIMFSTFHQSYSYEEFIGGIMPKLKDSSKEQSSDEKKDDNLLYELEPGKFKAFCDKVQADKEQGKDGNYVFVIDEINRGNISKIFGELITLIEESKRLGEKEEMKLQIPHFKEEFGVPNNVYIIGTMNTADRSIALIDTALRRRFNFIEMMPNPKILEGVNINKELDICKMLETINKRISVLYDREHTIGHAYFTGLIENPTLVELAEIFRNSIIPLLQEYFYEDYEKIQLVLGDNDKSQNKYKFIKDKKVYEKKLFKGQTDIDIAEKEYEINQEAFSNPQSYIEIYSRGSKTSKGLK